MKTAIGGFHAVGCAAMFMFLLCSCSELGNERPLPEHSDTIELREVFRWNIDSMPQVVAAAISSDAAIFLAFADGSVATVRRETDRIVRVMSGVSVVGAEFIDTRRLSIVTDEGCEMQFHVDSLPRSLVPCNDRDLHPSLISAARLQGTGWIEQRLVDDSHIVRRRSDTTVLWRRQLADSGAGPLNMLPHLVAGSDAQMLVEWSSSPPLSASVWYDDEQPRRTWYIESRRFGLGDISNWRVLRPVALGQMWLVTLADLRSDLRVLVLMSDSGVLLRYKQINSPLGFLASSRSGHLLALSDIGRRELVLYCWESRQLRDATANTAVKCSP